MKKYEEFKKEIERVADEKTKQSKKYADNENNKPCSVCGSKEFVQKFRNVVGEISGSMHGYFSLFGGSVSGNIDGYTKTLPVLSCRKCENERQIETWNYTHEKDVFWNFMFPFYFGINYNEEHRFKEIDKYFLERPIETRQYALENKNWNYDWYNEITKWNPKDWARAGFEIAKIKKSFLWLNWEIYPTWKELISIKS